MSKSLYNKNTVTGKLFCFFSIYFAGLSAPTAESLAFLLVAMLALESAGSIRSLYRHFLAKATGKSLNAFYYLCSYAKVDYSGFMAVTAKIALGIIPDAFRPLPVLLCVDDTIVPKSGTKIEGVSKLFDHAAHKGCRYLDGHCFVSLMLCVPVWDNVAPGKTRTFSYLSVPLGYRMWKRRRSWRWLPAWCALPCPHFPGRRTSWHCVTAGMQKKISCALPVSLQTWTSYAAQGRTPPCMASRQHGRGSAGGLQSVGQSCPWTASSSQRRKLAAITPGASGS